MESSTKSTPHFIIGQLPIITLMRSVTQLQSLRIPSITS